MIKVSNSTKAYDEQYFSERDYLPPHLLNALEILLKHNKVKRILEVGVGSGKLMRKLKEEGYKVEGIDISPIAAKLTGAKVASATKMPYKDEIFDCVIGISIIEHLTKKEGEKFITEARRVLRDNGIIFLVTPNFASPLRRMQGEKWFAYSDKTHVYFYSPKTLKNLLQRYNFSEITSMFKVTTPELEWPLPNFVTQLPVPLRKWINYILISSPLALWRDSFWIRGSKNT